MSKNSQHNKEQLQPTANSQQQTTEQLNKITATANTTANSKRSNSQQPNCQQS
jgi:hypothetical protein